MSRKPAGLLFAVCLLGALSACGGGRRGVLCDDDRFRDPRPRVVLSVPEDLDKPVSTENYRIPPQSGNSRRDDVPCSDYPPRLIRVQETPATPDAPAQPAPVAAAPVSQPASVPALTADITQTLAAWVVAWEHRNFESYLSFYADDFVPPGELSRPVWREARLRRMSEGAQAVVRLDTLVVTGDGQRAAAEFLQTFDFEGISSAVVKRLELVKLGGAWKIVAEQVVEVR